MADGRTFFASPRLEPPVQNSLWTGEEVAAAARKVGLPADSADSAGRVEFTTRDEPS